jgi:hypothetical protein
MTEQRKLAAIMLTDILGYSAYKLNNNSVIALFEANRLNKYS